MKDAKPRLIWWILLLQEFNRGSENMVADHLAKLENGNEEIGINIKEIFPDEQLLRVDVKWPWLQI